MTLYKKAALLCTFAVGFCLLASSAFAGPIWSFGDEDQGLLKLDYKGQFQLVNQDNGDDDSLEFNFRRNRIALMGAYGESFGLYVQTEYTEDNDYSSSDGDRFQLLDAVLRFKFNNSLNLWMGKFKYNLTRENLEACEMPLTLDRSSMIRAPFVSTRDKGIAVWGNLANDMIQYRVDAMNGNDSEVDSNLRYSARVHVSLLDPEKGYGYKGTYMGQKKVLTFGAAYQMENDVAYSDSVTGDAVDYSAWTVDAFFEYPIEGMGAITLSAAYVDYDLDDAYQGANPDAGVTGMTGEKNGGYVKAGYMLPNLPLQFFGRSESWSFADLYGVMDHEVELLGLGLNYYVRGQNLKVTVEYTNCDYDSSSTAEDSDTVVAQVQVIF
ncbi:short chain amide porin [Desulfuromusa kysingii]|uniref:Short chain amide porin n=1 Tax=Desulfuromusa kysingii TaxID=37625 RepID=A0A1H4CQU7_9BACT|nr:selenite/tellurite reduction operon porin ExtI [Desulfuromusa kysingii]SEA62754.1 short chain amide porin [Desulfuromusa kysingii]